VSGLVLGNAAEWWAATQTGSSGLPGPSSANNWESCTSQWPPRWVVAPVEAAGTVEFRLSRRTPPWVQPTHDTTPSGRLASVDGLQGRRKSSLGQGTGRATDRGDGGAPESPWPTHRGDRQRFEVRAVDQSVRPSLSHPHRGDALGSSPTRVRRTSRTRSCTTRPTGRRCWYGSATCVPVTSSSTSARTSASTPSTRPSVARRSCRSSRFPQNAERVRENLDLNGYAVPGRAESPVGPPRQRAHHH
jgi:hypothetical protein